MKYKADKSYKELKDSQNYNAFMSPMKHQRLLNEEWVEITNLPKSLNKHLIKQGQEKPVKEKNNG